MSKFSSFSYGNRYGHIIKHMLVTLGFAIVENSADGNCAIEVVQKVVHCIGKCQSKREPADQKRKPSCLEMRELVAEVMCAGDG